MYSRIAPYFALRRIFSPANEKALLKQNNQSNFKSCLKKPNELQENEKKTFETFYKPAHYWINKTSVSAVFERLKFAISKWL